MSFDIFFLPCRFEGRIVEKPNPFTGEVQSVCASEPLNATELKAVENVLKQSKANGPNEFGCYVVELKDGSAAEVFGDDLDMGCMVTLRGMTPDLSRFLYELLKAGNWVMLPVMEDAVAITTSLGCLIGLPSDFPRVVVCHSSEELAILLAGGLGAWEKYRDQVVGDNGQ